MNLARDLITMLPRLRGVKVGPGTYVSPRATIREHRRIEIGSLCSVGRLTELHPQGGFIRVGNNCSVNNLAVVYGAGGVTVGDDCRIANGAVIIAFNHKFADPDRPIRAQGVKALGIRIESDVWIGARALVLDGVTIGEGSVIGAGAVVTRDIPKRSVAVGNPARVVSVRA